MRAISWVLVGLAAVTAVGLIVPATRFAPRNHVDMLAGRWMDTFGDVLPADIVPRFVVTRKDGDPKRDLIASLDGRLVDAKVDLGPLVAKHFDTPLGWAACVMNELGSVSIFTPTQEPRTIDRDPIELARRRGRFRMAREAASRGAVLDPSNAYFPLALAVCAQGVGDIPARGRQLALAADCSRYESYVSELNDWRVKFAVQDHGHRGNSWDLLAGAVYVDRVAHDMWPLCRNIQLEEPRLILTSLRAFRTAYLSVSKVADLDCFLSASLTLFRSPKGSPYIRSDTERQARLLDRVRAAVAALKPTERQALDFDPVAFVKELQQACGYDLAHPDEDGYPNDNAPVLDRLLNSLFPGNSTYLASSVLAATLACLLVGAMALWLSRLASAWSLGPCAALAATTAWTAFDTKQTWGWSGTEAMPYLLGGYALLTLLAAFARLRKGAVILGFLLPVLLIAMRPWLIKVNGGPYPALPLIVFTVLLLRLGWLKWRGQPKRLSWVLFLLIGLCIVGVGYSFVMARLATPPEVFVYPWDALLFALFVALAAHAWQNVPFAETARHVSRAAPSMLAIAWFCYLGTWAFDVREDARFARVAQHRRDEAPKVRAWASARGDIASDLE